MELIFLNGAQFFKDFICQYLSDFKGTLSWNHLRIISLVHLELEKFFYLHRVFIIIFKWIYYFEKHNFAGISFCAHQK